LFYLANVNKIQHYLLVTIIEKFLMNF